VGAGRPAVRAVGRMPPRRSRPSNNSSPRTSSSRRPSARRALHAWRAAATASNEAWTLAMNGWSRR
jgi:hypothetical protein